MTRLFEYGELLDHLPDAEKGLRVTYSPYQLSYYEDECPVIEARGTCYVIGKVFSVSHEELDWIDEYRDVGYKYRRETILLNDGPAIAYMPYGTNFKKKEKESPNWKKQGQLWYWKRIPELGLYLVN